MRSLRAHAMRSLTALSLVGIAATTAHAQVATAAAAKVGAVAGRAMQVMPYAGYLVFGNFINGPLGTSLGSAGAPLYGVQLGMQLAPGVSIVGNVAHAAGDLKVGIPILGGIDVGQSSALLVDGGLQLALPSPRTSGIPIVPFVQAGVGAIRWDLDLGSSLLQTHATSLAGNVGAGIDMPFGDAFGLRFMAKDYIGKFDFKEATSLDLAAKTTHNWALSAGLRLSF